MQQTLRVNQTSYWCCRLWCRLLSTTASCSSWQLQVNWISTARFLSVRPKHSVDCNTCSATTFVLYVLFHVLMTRAHNAYHTSLHSDTICPVRMQMCSVHRAQRGCRGEGVVVFVFVGLGVGCVGWWRSRHSPLSFRHSCWPYLICNHIHSVPVVPIFVNDVEILVTCRPWLHSTCHHCAELHTFFFNLALTFVLRVFKFCHLTSRRVSRTPDFLVPSCVALNASSNSVLPASCNDFHILPAFTVTSVISCSVGKSILNSCCFLVKCWLLSSPASLFNATLFLEASDTQINTRSN